jgi:hypothetical protein
MDSRDDLLGIDALQVDAGRAEVGMTQLSLIGGAMAGIRVFGSWAAARLGRTEGSMRGIGRLIAATAVCAVALGGMAASTEAASSGGAEWTVAKLPGLAGSLFLLNVSCPSESLCVATGSQNVIASSTNPTGGVGAWKVVYAGEGTDEIGPSGPVGPVRQIQGVSCPTTHLCVAVTALGQIYATTNPTGPASSWNVTEVPSEGGNTHLYGVSCPTASLCVAVSGRRANRGKVFTSTNPTGGPETWHPTDLGDSYDFRAVSCSSPNLCVAAGANGELVASTDPTGGLSAWSNIGTPGGSGSLQTISCVPGLCLSGNNEGNLLTSTSPRQASSWRQRNGGGSVLVTGTSCPSSSACIAVDNNGHVSTSTTPTGGASAWTSTAVAPYSPETEEFDPEHPNGLFGASCPSGSFCTVVGSGGQIYTSTNPFAPPPAPTKNTTGESKKRLHGPKRPTVTIGKFVLPSPRELRERRAHVQVRFHANGTIRRFECKIDRRRFLPCRSPERFRVEKDISGFRIYDFRVRAVGMTGLRGPIAVKRFWTGERCTRHYCLNGGGELPPKPRR